MATADQLSEQLASGAPPDRLAAATTLASLGPGAAGAAAALVAACGSAELRDVCVGALEEMGPPSPDQLPRLGELVASLDVDTAYWAATLLGRAGEDAAAFAARLASVAVDRAAPAPARERAVWALGKIGPPAAAVTPLLQPLVTDDENPRLQRLVAESLSRIDG